MTAPVSSTDGDSGGMSTGARYDQAFFAGLQDGSYRSAAVVVPRLLSLLKPNSVVDFGCGLGAWLRVFRESGVVDVLGLDGPYVADDMLVIPRQNFRRADLSSPIDLNRTYDLVVSLEVGEHLDADKAPIFVETLTRHGRVVLFSAAVPQQGGEHHVNEQWPRYWSALFAARGFRCLDCLRPVLWEDDRVEWWYRQNLLLFVGEELADTIAAAAPPVGENLPLSMVHPLLYREAYHRHNPFGVGGLLRQVPEAIRTSWRWYRERARG